jgi:hypothetical protein
MNTRAVDETNAALLTGDGSIWGHRDKVSSARSIPIETRARQICERNCYVRFAGCETTVSDLFIDNGLRRIWHVDALLFEAFMDCQINAVQGIHIEIKVRYINEINAFKV